MGFAAGYVLGSKAGRERYEQIRAGATRVWESNQGKRVRDSVQQVTEQATGRLRAIAEEKIDLTEAAPAFRP